MTKVNKLETVEDHVRGFATSMRGQFIIGQALHVAIETMDKETDIRFRESSNIEDMKYLRDNLYSLFTTLTKIDTRGVDKQI
jgi:hypothetical protein